VDSHTLAYSDMLFEYRGNRYVTRAKYCRGHLTPDGLRAEQRVTDKDLVWGEEIARERTRTAPLSASSSAISTCAPVHRRAQATSICSLGRAPGAPARVVGAPGNALWPIDPLNVVAGDTLVVEVPF
jgi:hypothetical protein